MRAFKNESRVYWLLVASLLCTVAVPWRSLADDKTADKNTSDPPAKPAPAKPAAVKIDAPAPGLTERERWLLDEVEALKRRVADLESKANAPAAPATEATSAQPGSPKAASPTIFGTTQSIAAGAMPANSESVSSTSSRVVASVEPQATEKGKAAGVAKPGSSEPFSFADWSWLTGNARPKDTPYDTKFFTPEFRADINYVYDFNHPKDDTIGGSSEVFRSNEMHVTDIGIGGDFHYNNVPGRILSQIGF